MVVAFGAVGFQARAGYAAQSPAAAPPIPWQDQAPVARLFLQPPFEEPELLAPGQASAEARIAYSNSILLAGNERFRIDLDGETLRSAIVLRYGLFDRLETSVELPIFLDQGGGLDGLIEAVEERFGAANPARRAAPRDKVVYSLSRPDGRALVRRGDDAGIGDVVFGAKVRLLDQAGWRPAISLRGLVKAPTGGFTFGSGGTDLGAGLLAGWTWRRTALRLALDVVRPGEALEEVGLDTRTYGSVQVGLAFRANRRLTLDVQVSGHTSPIRGTGLSEIEGPTYYVVAGGSYAVSTLLSIDLGAAENVLSPGRGADFTFLSTLRARF